MPFPEPGPKTERAKGWTRWLERERRLVALGLLVLVALAWIDLVRGTGVLSLAGLGHEMAMPRTTPWSPADMAVTAAMWSVMMAAMMLPAAAPMLLLFATVNRRRKVGAGPAVPTGIFLLGYLLVWGGFSLLATLAQWGLHTLMLLSPRLAIAHPLASGLVLAAAGAYQFTPLKQACLVHCRSPLDFLFTNWRDGAAGALRMGLVHGGYCLGCCWVLMALLFVGGVMNLLWIAALALFVLLEKAVVRGPWLSRLAGLVLIGWAVYVLGAGFPS